MDSTRYIGRVGALAVALGIGAAMSTGAGHAWAEDAGSDAGSSNTGDSTTGVDTGQDSGSAPDTRPARTGPLAAVADRIRKDADTRKERRNDAVEQIRREVDKARTRLDDSAADLRAKLKDLAPPTATPPAALTGLRGAADKSESPQVVADAVDAVPDLRRPKRPGTVVVQVAEATRAATEKIAQRTADALEPAREALRPHSALRIDATPIGTLEIPALDKDIDVRKLTTTTVMSTLLAATGLAPWADTGPRIPRGPSALALAVLGWTRRETSQAAAENEITVPEGQVAALLAADDVYDANPGLAPAPDVPGSLGSTDLGLVTGGNPDTGPGGPTAHWYIAGTDLGIMWDSGYVDEITGQPIVYSLFGDSYSETGMRGDWRNNVLFRTVDDNLNNGLAWNAAVVDVGAQFPGDPSGTPTWYGTGGAPAGAMQIITDPDVDGLFGRTYTLIPTAPIAVPDDTAEGGYIQYATVMSVRTWDTPGRWTTNYSALAYSTDGGETWTIDTDTVRSSGWLRSTKDYVPGDEHFQQNALVYGNPDDPDSWTAPDGDPTRERYVYVYGTPSGRGGSAYLARVPESQIRDLDEYQYWTGTNSDGTGDWKRGDPSKAVPIIGSSENDFIHRVYKFFDCFTFGLFSKILNGIWVGGLPTFGNVSEISVQYNQYAERYLITYTDGGNNVVMRVADTPQGKWSDSITLRSRASGWYAPMIHPLSGTSELGAGNEQYLYYNLSNWDQYNVHLLRTDIAPLLTA
jgi:Domain of unknown function (DUF4185)